MYENHNPSKKNQTRVCLVTEELAGIGGAGGIGAAFLELAKLLAGRGLVVDILYCPVAAGNCGAEDQMQLKEEFGRNGIKLSFLDATHYVSEPVTYEKKSYAVAQWLSDKSSPYSFVHFHDYKGLGFFSTSLKRQGLAFALTDLIVQLHGPTRWTIEANGAFFVHEDQLKIDHMERMSIAQADCVISPSAYLVEWLRKNDFTLPKNALVIKNVCSELQRTLTHYNLRHDSAERASGVTDIVFFARHEDRKGFVVFCEALELIHDDLVEARVTVSFVGKFGMVGSQPSGAYLIDRANKWRFPIKIRTGLARNEAAQFITSRGRPVVVIPSPSENSPYTVLESIMLGVPVISSLDGGGPELFRDADYAGLCQINSAHLAKTIVNAIRHGLAIPKPAETSTEIEKHWLDLHAQKVFSVGLPPRPLRSPKVTFAITHHERPGKLIDAVLSAVKQTYKNIEIVVIDDGSKSPQTLAELAHIEDLLIRVGGRLVRQENAYLGAARNCAIRNAQGEYICFLDDDDIAFPELVETLVTAAESTHADAVNCLNIFMDESLRGDVLARTAKVPRKVSYVPLGGPLALAPVENCLGAATALFRKSSLVAIGGYSELKGVGHEDYELFIRLLQAEKTLTIVPRPLYFYEVGRPSMLSRTSMVANFRRCFNALDTDRDSHAWRDALSLSVGKQTSVNAHNRQWWLYSLTKTAALRHRILGESLDRSAMLGCLKELAAQEGATRLAAAFAEDAAVTKANSGETYISFDELIDTAEQIAGNAIGTQTYATALLDARLDMALGRHVDAIRALSQHIAEVKFVDAAAAELVKQFINETRVVEVETSVWQGLAKALRSSRHVRGTTDEMKKSLVILSLLCSDLNTMLKLVHPDINRLDSAYLERYADVRDGVEKGQFSSGLEHFLIFGMQEGRSGFDVLSDVLEFSLAVPVTRELFEKFLSACQTISETTPVERDLA